MSANRIAAAGLGLSVVTAIILAVLWAATSLAGKAPIEQVNRHELRLTQAELRDAWLMGAVYELAKHEGVVVPPPPGPNVSP